MLFPPPLGPISATVSPGAIVSETSESARAGRSGIRERDGLEPDRGLADARGLLRARDDRHRLLDQPEQPVGDRDAVGARVEPGCEVAQRQVELGRQHEHRQRGLEGDPAVDEPHADRDGDERDAERRGELEHRAGEEREAERAHRRAAVLVADLLDPRGLRLASVEGPQRRQPADDVEEVGREERHRLPALPGAAARSPGR